MVKLSSQFNYFDSFNALVLGDYMLDTYTTGYVERISPEAPVCVLKVENQTSQPGGAGNVILNLLSLGGHVVCLGKVGSDYAGRLIKEKLQKAGADISGIFEDEKYQTPIKNRLIAENQQVLRVDTENPFPGNEAFEKALLQQVCLEKIDVVVISDYNKGSITKKLISRLIHEANKKNVPVVVDPKGDNFTKYKNATLIKPNFKEACLAAKTSQEEPLEAVAQTLLDQTNAKMLLVTLSASGMSLFQRDCVRKDFPVQIKEVMDVTGAGDTVSAVISACLANKIDIDHAITYANIAASYVIEKLGCAQITLPLLAKRLLEVDVENKIFEQSHVFALKKVLEKSTFSILAVNSAEGFTTKLLQTIKRLSMENEHVIVYLLDKNPNEDFISFLSSLKEVHFVVLKKSSLLSLFDELKPKKQIVFLEKENIQPVTDLLKQNLS